MDGATLSVGESFQRTDKMGMHAGCMTGRLLGFSTIGKLHAAIIETHTGEMVVYVRLTTEQLHAHKQKERVLNPISVPL